MQKGTLRVKTGLAEMLKGGVIMDVTTVKQAKIAETAGAVAVMALYKIPADVRASGGVARTAPVENIEKIMKSVSIPVMAKCRIGHYGEARALESLGVDYIDESEVLTRADSTYHLNKWDFQVPVLNGCRNLKEALRRIEEGSAMLRTKGEPGTGDIKHAVDHMRVLRNDIAYVVGLYELKRNLKKIGKEKIYGAFMEIDTETFAKVMGMKIMDEYYKNKECIGMYDELKNLFRNKENKLDVNYFEKICKIKTTKLIRTCQMKNSLEKEIDSQISEIKHEYGVSSALLEYVGKNRKLPVVNFAAGGVSTPADAALMMKLGSEGIFVGSGIFKSRKPEVLARAIVEATTNYNNPEIIKKVSYNLGEPMRGIAAETMKEKDWMQYRSD